eukprot:6261135-Pyramimonas_sp.AAC.1
MIMIMITVLQTRSSGSRTTSRSRTCPWCAPDYRPTPEYHDRAFLDQLCTKIVETEHGVAKTWKGNYSDYVNQKNTWVSDEHIPPRGIPIGGRAGIFRLGAFRLAGERAYSASGQ